MLTWLIVAIVVLLAGGAVALGVARAGSGQRRLSGPAKPAAPLLERTVREVRAGDVLMHAGRDYVVEGVVLYDEDGHTWRTAYLVDGGETRALLVGLERAPGLTLRFLAPATGADIRGYPSEIIEHAGTAYRLAQRGTATCTIDGKVELPGAGTIAAGTSTRCRWWRYQAPGERFMIVEQWGDGFRAQVGEAIKAGDVELLGAS